MLRNPRVWLYAAGGWLVLTGLAHLSAHLWVFVLEHGIEGQRAFAMSAMKQAFSLDPLRPSMWRTFRAISASFGLLLVFAGIVDLLLAARRAPPEVVRAVGLAATVFWTFAFGVYAFMDPVVQPLVIALVAVPLHGLVTLTAGSAGD